MTKKQGNKVSMKVMASLAQARAEVEAGVVAKADRKKFGFTLEPHAKKEEEKGIQLSLCQAKDDPSIAWSRFNLIFLHLMSNIL